MEVGSTREVVTREEARAAFELMNSALQALRDGEVPRNDELFWLEFLACVRNSADAAFSEAALRLKRSETFKQAQFLSAEACTAFVSGSSKADAHRVIKTAERLEEHPQLREDFAAGHISLAQVSMVAEGASLIPESFDTLLDFACNDTHEALEKELRRVRAIGLTPKDETEARRKTRFRIRPADRFGHFISGYMLNDQIATLSAVAMPITNQIFRTSQRDGSFVSREHCFAQAIVELAKRACGGEGKGPRPHITYVVSKDAADRGEVRYGERCEIQGVGPVSLESMRALMNDAYVSFVVTDFDHSENKYRPSTNLKRAMDAFGTTCTMLGCDNEICDRDHNEERRDGGKTSRRNMDQLCRQHHTYKTKHRMKLVGPRGRRQMIRLGPESRAGPKP